MKFHYLQSYLLFLAIRKENPKVLPHCQFPALNGAIFRSKSKPIGLEIIIYLFIYLFSFSLISTNHDQTSWDGSRFSIVNLLLTVVNKKQYIPGTPFLSKCITFFCFYIYFLSRFLYMQFVCFRLVWILQIDIFGSDSR